MNLETKLARWSLDAHEIIKTGIFLLIRDNFLREIKKKEPQLKETLISFSFLTQRFPKRFHKPDGDVSLLLMRLTLAC